ncbi:MAG TPA: hypothetical protein VFR06_09000, partial [Gallionellaceae bacterium]|nr:hypothetical protein [Gallionellaceae bacterium]
MTALPLNSLLLLPALLPSLLLASAHAQDLTPAAGQEDWNAKFQSTYVWQHKPAFDAPYTGPLSL